MIAAHGKPLAPLLILGLACVAVGTWAGEGTDLSLTLDQALTRAVANSPRLDGLKASEEAARATVRGAKAARSPLLNLSAGYTRLSNVDPFAIGLPGGKNIEISPNIPNATVSRLNLSCPLFTGGRISGGIRAAEDEALSGEQDLRAGRADLILETTQAYWNLVTAGEAASVLDSALVAYEQHLKDAHNREQVGLAASNEILAVEVERDRAEITLLQAENAETSANANLQRLLGLSPQIHCRPLDAVTENLRSQAEHLAASSLDSLVAEALTTRPELLALTARLEAARMRTRMEKGAHLPQLAVGAGYDYARPNRRITPAEDEWKETWDASLSLSMTVFDGGRISSAVDRASAQAAALAAQMEDLRRRIRLEILTKTLDLSTAAKAQEVAERALQSAVQNRKVALDRYGEGVGSSSDLLDAEVVLLRAGLERTEARARLVLARTSLERALGRSA